MGWWDVVFIRGWTDETSVGGGGGVGVSWSEVVVSEGGNVMGLTIGEGGTCGMPRVSASRGSRWGGGGGGGIVVDVGAGSSSSARTSNIFVEAKNSSFGGGGWVGSVGYQLGSSWCVVGGLE